jgi:hypothetical protein
MMAKTSANVILMIAIQKTMTQVHQAKNAEESVDHVVLVVLHKDALEVDLVAGLVVHHQNDDVLEVDLRHQDVEVTVDLGADHLRDFPNTRPNNVVIVQHNPVKSLVYSV